MGLMDIPAIYSEILKNYQGQKKIIYMGVSQGSSAMFAGLCDQKTKEYLTKNTEIFYAMAPVVYMTNIEFVLSRIRAYFYEGTTPYINLQFLSVYLTKFLIKLQLLFF